jgi:hypothetical protein
MQLMGSSEHKVEHCRQAHILGFMKKKHQCWNRIMMFVDLNQTQVESNLV